MYVIGTAGHVDHGKSSLVQALTGVDPDRLREEKERGLTIDLGFAQLVLPGGVTVSIVDVPGHERFIKNMLAGVGGIHLALLVVAADEGVMPQTREHLAIVDLLAIDSGVVALTKCDLVDEDTLSLAQDEIRELVAGTALEGAPVVACSARSRAGMDQLKAVIELSLAGVAPKGDAGRPRLPIDRVFTMPGFGTVITGTLQGGVLETGQDVEVLPQQIRARIRGLQHHGEQVTTARPGRRTAVNLSGVSVDDLDRGMVLTLPGNFSPVTTLDARMTAVRYLPRPVRHNSEVTFHVGSSETTARLSLLDSDELRPGDSGWAQLRLQAPAVCVPGDRFIIRDPNDTLGGGRIVATGVPRHRRHHAPTLAALELLERSSPAERLLAELDGGPISPEEAARRLATTESTVRTEGQKLQANGRAFILAGEGAAPELWVSTTRFNELAAMVMDSLSKFHARAPLRRGIQREELRRQLGLPAAAFSGLLLAMEAARKITLLGPVVGDASHQPVLSKQQAGEVDAYLRSLAETPYSPPTDNRPGAELLVYLEQSGKIVRVQDLVFARQAYDAMVEGIASRLRTGGSVTLAQVRDMFGTSRRYAQSLLEHLDAQNVTRRVGDERVLR